MGTQQLRPFLHQRLALGKAMSGRITKQMHCTQPGWCIPHNTSFNHWTFGSKREERRAGGGKRDKDRNKWLKMNSESMRSHIHMKLSYEAKWPNVLSAKTNPFYINPYFFTLSCYERSSVSAGCYSRSLFFHKKTHQILWVEQWGEEGGAQSHPSWSMSPCDCHIIWKLNPTHLTCRSQWSRK